MCFNFIDYTCRNSCPFHTKCGNMFVLNWNFMFKWLSLLNVLLNLFSIYCTCQSPAVLSEILKSNLLFRYDWNTIKKNWYILDNSFWNIKSEEIEAILTALFFTIAGSSPSLIWHISVTVDALSGATPKKKKEKQTYKHCSNNSIPGL